MMIEKSVLLNAVSISGRYTVKEIYDIPCVTHASRETCISYYNSKLSLAKEDL